MICKQLSCFLDLQEMFEKVEAARDEALETAVKSIQEASMRILDLIQKIIAEAIEGDHSGKPVWFGSNRWHM